MLLLLRDTWCNSGTIRKTYKDAFSLLPMPPSSPHPISICHSSLAPAPRAPPLFPSLSVTSFRAPALMSHSSSGSSPEIGMGRVAELQSRARHISYSPGALLRARHQIRPCSRLLPSLHIQLLCSVFFGAPLPAPPLQIFLIPSSVPTPCLSTSAPPPLRCTSRGGRRAPDPPAVILLC